MNKRGSRSYGRLETIGHENVKDRSWSYITVGYGHGEQWWREFCYRLRLNGYDGWLSIEHEDIVLVAHGRDAQVRRSSKGDDDRRKKRLMRRARAITANHRRPSTALEMSSRANIGEDCCDRSPEALASRSNPHNHCRPPIFLDQNQPKTRLTIRLTADNGRHHEILHLRLDVWQHAD